MFFIERISQLITVSDLKSKCRETHRGLVFFYVFYSSTNFYSKRFKDMLNFTSRVCSFHTVLSNSSLGKEKESKNGFVFYFSEKKKEQPMGIVTLLGAGNEVGRSFRGKNILVSFRQFRVHPLCKVVCFCLWGLIMRTFLFWTFNHAYLICLWNYWRTREWLRCLTSMKLILQPSLSSWLLNMFIILLFSLIPIIWFDICLIFLI